jgi:hypothetical protein
VDGLEKEDDSESDLTAQLAKTFIASLDSGVIGCEETLLLTSACHRK